MPWSPEQLERHLDGATALKPVYLLAGDEHLLLFEAADALRRKARALGFAEREVLDVEQARGFDWNALARAGATLSLFAARKLIDLRLPGGKPDKEGAEAITEYLERASPDAVLLITCTTWSKAHETRWVDVVAEAGAFVVFWPLKRAELDAWVAARARRAGVELAPDAVAALIERTEGHLLAAAQEIDKLTLLATGQRVDAALLASLVADSARFDVFKLTDAALGGELHRALRIAAALRAEGEAVPALLPWFAAQLAQVLRLAGALEAGQPIDQALRAAGVWAARQPAFRSALRRGRASFWEARLVDAARIELASKGRLRHRDPWVEFERLVAAVADPTAARVLAP